MRVSLMNLSKRHSYCLSQTGGGAAEVLLFALLWALWALGRWGTAVRRRAAARTRGAAAMMRPAAAAAAVDDAAAATMRRQVQCFVGDFRGLLGI